ncbi:MAG: T9SS type A sorting domain-containing protein [Calditrichaceae bacterium]|nr:T9SS type A sorting domain-containing protein [Calditrichaceae bacterium]
MKSLKELLTLLLLSITILSAQNASLKLGLACYTDVEEEQRKIWLDERFKLRISGYEPLRDDVMRMSYYDIFGFYISHYIGFKDWARSHNIDYEEILLHSKTDFIFTADPAWSYMDMFGRLEDSEYSPLNGILETTDHITFIDHSGQAYDNSNIFTLNNTIYIGYEEPFADINFEFSAIGEEVDWSFEYYNGTEWTDIPAYDDNTSDFTVSGLLSFLPPNDWEITSVNESHEKYFVRIIFNSATTYPSVLRIYGDDWLNGAGDACRGWDPDDENIINSGNLVYNPNPPVGASAKFPYQARVPFWWGNRFVANPADIQNIDGEDRYTWAMYCSQDIINAGDYDGIMCDDAQAIPAIDPANTDFADKTDGKTWEEYNIFKYGFIREYIQEEEPEYLMGCNSYNEEMVFTGDWNVVEFFTVVHNTGDMNNMGDDTYCSPWMISYDVYLPENNPNGVFGLMMYYDYADSITNDNISAENPYPWDRSDRGPIAALALHYIGQNGNTFFNYHGQLGYVYNETDEVLLKNGSVIHQGLESAPKCEDVHRWSRFFPSMAVDIGIPDSKGYNGGERDVQWKTAEEADMVRRGGNARGHIGRRDYTNAIVLYRGANWDSNYEEYATYSNSFDLGGTYYPLKADGTVGDSISSIALRLGEGAILMYSPYVNGINNKAQSDKAIPSDYSLLQNYPNPFNPITNIEYQISNTGFVTLKIFDTLGREVVTLVNKQMPAGIHTAQWNGKNVQGQPVVSGIYYYQIQTSNGHISTKRMLMLK